MDADSGRNDGASAVPSRSAFRPPDSQTDSQTTAQIEIRASSETPATAEIVEDRDAAGVAALAELAARHPDDAAPLSVSPSALAARVNRRSSASTVRPRILLVEDSPVDRLLIGVLLDRLGLDHVAVGCGEEAIYRFAREPFDAIVIDIAMDGLGGLSAARALNALAGAALPPLVALGAEELSPETLEEAGISAIANRPLDTNRLAAALVAAIEHDLDAELPV